eukprot:Nk52_evm21s2657 gene=Nk52_evmTU21s2657
MGKRSREYNSSSPFSVKRCGPPVWHLAVAASILLVAVVVGTQGYSLIEQHADGLGVVTVLCNCSVVLGPEKGEGKVIVLGGTKILGILPFSPICRQREKESRFTPRESFVGLSPKVLDLEGDFVLPGLIDPHSHIIGGGGEEGPESMIPEARLSQIINAGVTTLVGLLGTDGVGRSIERLAVKVHALNRLGITSFMYSGSYRYPPVTITGSALKDIMLFAETIGVGEIALSDHRSSNPTLEELSKLAADIHTGGILSKKKSKMHFHMGKERSGMQMLWSLLNTTALPIELFYPTHISDRGLRLRDEGMQWVKQGGFIDLTCDRKGESATLDALDVYRNTPELDMSHITLSTDSYGSFPVYDEQQRLVEYEVLEQKSMLRTIKRLVVERKWALEEAIALCTSNTAAVFGMDAKGHVKVGYDADLIVLDRKKNDLKDKDRYLRLKYVFAKGNAMKTPSWTAKDMFET